MSTNEEVEYIGPAFRRQGDSIHRGFWTPELGEWREDKGYTEIRDLQSFTWNESVKYTGVKVNASPVLCVIKTQIGHNPLTVTVSGLVGQPDPNENIVSGNTTISGFTIDYQYNEPIYRRAWSTGGGEFSYTFTIPPHTMPGQVYKLPNKRIYKISDVSVSGGISDQAIARLGFYALADNGSKLLYSMNWNKIFEYGRNVLYGAYGNPNKCPRCVGSGYINDVSNTCQQCNGYKYSGPNASGFLETQIGYDYGLIKDADTTDSEFRNKIWAMNWWVTPTKKEIQRYFAHFARIEADEIEVNNIDRIASSTLPTGVEKVVDLLLPYNIPLSVFDKSDKIWDEMVQSVETAGIDIRFSFLVGAFTGNWEWEDWDSVYPSGIVNAETTGWQFDYVVYGVHEPISRMDHGSNSFYSEWGEDYHFFNHLCKSVHPSGYISGLSGIQMNSGATHSWESGAIEGWAWTKWAEVSGGDGKGDVWSTGDNNGIRGFDQDAMWSISGNYYLDNFWASGDDGIQY
jgi:hypothetical protein